MVDAEEAEKVVTFYTDPEKRTIKRELFSTTADELADRLDKADRKKNKRSQIRKFYDEVLRLNALAKTAKDDGEDIGAKDTGDSNAWDDILPYLNMLIAKAVYAEGRELVTVEFVDFIKNSINQVKVPKDLDVFAGFFEALMGFYRKYRRS
jgi:CRISPR-associated protein Csm2